MPRCEPFSVSVPATSANLGPGFDAVGIALGVRIRAHVESARAFSISFKGLEAPTHDAYEELIVAAMRRIEPELPRVRIAVENNIPLGKGLGSSAAACVLGAAIAAKAHGLAVDRIGIARIACDLEGHPDNALAAVFGGAVIAASGDVNSYVRIRNVRGVCAELVIPNIDLSTKQARTLLPERYSRADVVFTAQRAALLGAALATGEWSALREAMRDRVHQPYRAPHIPGLAAALDIRSRNLLGVALSGAGPSVIALMRRTRDGAKIGDSIACCFSKAGIEVDRLSVGLGGRGLSVVGG
jgi:homoserine kinase